MEYAVPQPGFMYPFIFLFIQYINIYSGVPYRVQPAQHPQ